MKRLIVFAVVVLSSTVHAEPELTVAATPVLSPKTGTYASAQTVTITDSTSGAIIYYTTNGSTPTTASSKYTAAIKVTTTESIKAIAVAKGDANRHLAHPPDVFDPVRLGEAEIAVQAVAHVDNRVRMA